MLTIKHLKFFTLTLVLSFICPAIAALASTDLVRVKVQAVAPDAQIDTYYLDLLRMALEASKAPNERIEFVYATEDLSKARWISLLQNHRNPTVIWTMTSKERESVLRPIRVPIFKGLSGNRIFIIRKEDQPRFDKIFTKEQLSGLVAGQGVNWVDTRILQYNNLPVSTAISTSSLYRMLEANRFDYLPRSVIEGWQELGQHPNKDLAVEKNLLLIYPTAFYFFVSKSNEALAQRIEQGLEKLIDNGKFDEFFFSQGRVRKAIDQLKIHPRRIIYLTNPDLPEATPLNTPKYWVDIPQLVKR